MRHTIELSEAGEASLRDLARSAGQPEDAMLAALADVVLLGNAEGKAEATIDFVRRLGVKTVALASEDGEPPIRSTPNVMGGDACVRNTRIPVWMLVGYKQAGFSDERILRNYPSLGPADLTASWDFYAANAERVEGERRRHEEAD